MEYNFIGQQRIRREIFEVIVPSIVRGERLNLFLKARSGMGKTMLASMIAEDLGVKLNWYTGIYIPNDDGKVGFSPKYQVQILDEVHKLKNPEPIYPRMDSGQFVWILACNEFAKVKEPLVNRCIPFIFEQYLPEELAEIARNIFTTYGMESKPEDISLIVQASNGVPREVLINSKRIILAKKITPNLDVKDYLENTIGIQNGLNTLHRDYLQYLSVVEKAGIDTISKALRMDVDNVRQEIEPDLIFRGLITVSTSGRKITNAGLKEINKLKEYDG